MRIRPVVAASLLALALASSVPPSAGGPSASRGERALFVSVLQDPPVLSDAAEIRRLVRLAARTRTRTLFVQVYRSNRAWVATTVGDDRPYREARAKLGEDPLALLVRLAHREGIAVHAWVNLLSLGANAEAPLLGALGPSALTRRPGDVETLEALRSDGQFFLEPGDARVRSALGTLVEEIARAYPELDGLQFDYIRYPDWEPWYGYTEANLRRFREAHGRAPTGESDAAWQAWRREQVASLVRELRDRARAVNPRLAVSTTGLMPYARADREAFQDWKGLLERGDVDFVTLMAYTRDPALFERYLADALRHAPDRSKVYVAVGAYQFPGDAAAVGRQMALADRAGARGVAVLGYGDLLTPEGVSAMMGYDAR